MYGLRFLLKTEGLPYDFLKLPSIQHEQKLPVILSRQEIWRMLQSAQLLKHKLLIGLLYGCGLRCMEVRNLELKHLDFDRKLLHVVQSKGGKDRYVPLSKHLIRGLVNYISSTHPKKYVFEGEGKSSLATYKIKQNFYSSFFIFSKSAPPLFLDLAIMGKKSRVLFNKNVLII